MIQLRIVIALAAAVPLLGQSQVKAWKNGEAQSFRLPLAGLDAPPRPITEREYYDLSEYCLKTDPVDSAGYFTQFFFLLLLLTPCRVGLHTAPWPRPTTSNASRQKASESSIQIQHTL